MLRPGSTSSLISTVAFLGFAPAMFGQSEVHPFTFNVGGGFTAPTGRIANDIDYGGNVQAAAGLNFGRYLGVLGTFSFDAVGLTGSALSQVNAPNGYGHVFTFTVDPKITFPLGRGSFYVLGGGGWMRRTITFTQPALATTFIYAPWWGYIGPGYIQANQEIGSVSESAGTWDVGAGFNVPLPRGTQWKLYLEARYYDGLTTATHTTVVPVTLGLRW